MPSFSGSGRGGAAASVSPPKPSISSDSQQAAAATGVRRRPASPASPASEAASTVQDEGKLGQLERITEEHHDRLCTVERLIRDLSGVVSGMVDDLQKDFLGKLSLEVATVARTAAEEAEADLRTAFEQRLAEVEERQKWSVARQINSLEDAMAECRKVAEACGATPAASSFPRTQRGWALTVANPSGSPGPSCSPQDSNGLGQLLATHVLQRLATLEHAWSGEAQEVPAQFNGEALQQFGVDSKTLHVAEDLAAESVLLRPLVEGACRGGKGLSGRMMALEDSFVELGQRILSLERRDAGGGDEVLISLPGKASSFDSFNMVTALHQAMVDIESRLSSAEIRLIAQEDLSLKSATTMRQQLDDIQKNVETALVDTAQRRSGSFASDGSAVPRFGGGSGSRAAGAELKPMSPPRLSPARHPQQNWGAVSPTPCRGLANSRSAGSFR